MSKKNPKPINWSKVFHIVGATMGQMQFQWFYCFGTLLTLVRDRGVFKRPDDVDIGVFFDEYEPKYIDNLAQAYGFKVSKRLLCDVTKKPLFISLTPTQDMREDIGDIHIDFFAWVRYKKLLFHTYDVDMENPKGGIPKRYTFKGVPAWMIDDEIIKIDNVGGSYMQGKIPLRYGSLMDHWYENWIVPKQCVSSTQYQVRLKSMADWKSGTFKKEIWPEKQ